jgi:Fe2+ or Zn2+ uptake regulation protein
MNAVLEKSVLNTLLLYGEGLSATQLLTRLRPRVSQPTLWRTLDTLRAQGALIREGKARATRYHARERTDLAVLRSRRMHESVAKRLMHEPALRVQALERLKILRAANPHGRRYHDRWYELLQGPLVEVLRVMTEYSEVSDALRKESPLSAFVSPAERQRIFDSMRSG